MAEWKWDEVRQAWRKELWFNGTRTKLTFKGSKKDALAYEARKRLELGAKPQSPRTGQSAPGFERFCVDTYRPHAKATLRASTWKVRRYQIEPLIAFFADAQLTKITTDRVEAYKQERVASVSKVTVNSELTVLGAVLAYAKHLGKPCADPKLKRYPTRQRKGAVKAFTRDEVAAILVAAQTISSDFYALVRFLAETGARRGEAIALPRSRLDLTVGMVRIWSATNGEEEYETKSVEREVTLPTVLVALLHDHLKTVGDSPWVFPVPGAHPAEIVRLKARGWTSRDVADECGVAWQYVNRVWKRYADAPPVDGPRGRYAEWPKAVWARCLRLASEGRVKPIIGGPHRLRHTFASLFLQAKPDLFALGRVLGHSHTRVTELYSHLLPDHLETTRGVVTFENPTQNPTQENSPG